MHVFICMSLSLLQASPFLHPPPLSPHQPLVNQKMKMSSFISSYSQDS